MIWKYKEGTLCGEESLLKALEITAGADPAPVVSVAGAGGKTTILHTLAEEYAYRG